MSKEKQATKTEVAKTDAQPSALVHSDSVPAYLQQSKGRGTENVTQDDLVIPRLEIVQDLSPARKEADPNYIPGAKEGMMYNNVTRELYGKEVILIPVMYRKEYLLWKDRKKGGGFGGAFPTLEDAEDAIKGFEANEQGDWEAVDTGQQFCLLVKPNGMVEEIVVSMPRSKAKISRAWNSLIRMSQGDSFARAYKLSVVPETNKKNQSYYNFGRPSVAGFPSEAVYRHAEKLYSTIKSGKARADTTFEETDRAEDAEGTEY